MGKSFTDTIRRKSIIKVCECYTSRWGKGEGSTCALSHTGTHTRTKQRDRQTNPLYCTDTHTVTHSVKDKHTLARLLTCVCVFLAPMREANADLTKMVS